MDNNSRSSVSFPSSLNENSSSFSPSSSSSSSSTWSFLNINATTWLIIIVILAFLGFNVFEYLAKGTQTITDIFSPIFKKIFGTTIAVTGQAVDVSAEGAKAVVGGTASAIESGLTAIQDITPNTSTMKGQPIETAQKPDLKQQLPDNIHQTPTDYQPYEASGKSGWCFIGEDRGFRTCAQIGIDDTCMSGEIFPTQEICMNPNLRN
jgi:hypothetical protein